MLNIERACEIKGWQTLNELNWLAKHARGHNTIVEVGSYYGRSARCILDNFDGVLYCIDPWNGPLLNNSEKVIGGVNQYVYERFLENMNGHFHSGRVIPFRGVLNDFEIPGRIDMIFIDGDHRYEAVKNDINLALGMVRAGGIISGHDYCPEWSGVKRAVDETFGSDVNIYEGIWWVINE